MADRTPAITVVGLGPGDPRQLTVHARDLLATCSSVWVRTRKHPAVAALPAHLVVQSFDDLYESSDSFDAVYRGIAGRLLEAAASAPVVYAVPGDPTVGETAVEILRRESGPRGLDVAIVPGVSFIGPTLAALGWDALSGLQIADATVLSERHHPDIDPDRPALVAQVYSRLVAGDVKLTLLDQYPGDHPVTLVVAAGCEGERIVTMPLEELDRAERFDDLTTLAVPALPYPGSMLSLAEVVARLRAPDGCPWDREQTHESLRPYLLEEAYEVLDRLDAGDDRGLAEELGDLLLQIVLHAQLASEGSVFRLTDVVREITEKIVRRHPHVFGDTRAETAAQVLARWDASKAEERQAKGEDDPFSGIPSALPALARAQLVLRKGGAMATGQGDTGGEASLAEMPASAEERAARIGAALWAVVTVAREWDVDAETALRDGTIRAMNAARARAGAAERSQP